MAIVKSNVIGNLSGKLGNLSARTVNGHTVLAARPSSFNASNVPALIATRSKFAVTGKLSAKVISLAALKDIWKSFRQVPLSIFNTVVKSNFAYSAVDRPTVYNILTPLTGAFPLLVQSSSVLADNVSVELQKLTDASVFTPEEVNLSANGPVCYFNPLNPADPKFQIITLNDEIPNYVFNQTFEVNIALNVIQENIAAKYQNSVLLFAVASKNSEGKVIQYSSTHSKET